MIINESISKKLEEVADKIPSEITEQIAAIHEILELNIGHAIVAKSLSLGIAKAVADMKKIMLGAR